MIRYLLNTKRTIIAILITIPLAVVVGYFLLTPRAIISNLSDTSYGEFVIALPSSRISFSPIEANSNSTIYFSRQRAYGIGTYSLTNAEGSELAGSFQYPEGHEFGRVLRFTIDSNGVISFAM